jgi:hypothetical protein
MLSAELREIIIKRCAQHEEEERSKPNFRCCVVVEPYFIKYDNHVNLQYQYKTQQYIYEKAVNDPSAPRIPKIYDYFRNPDEMPMAYLVMEYIDVQPIPPRSVPEKVAEALQWLRQVPAPPDVRIGSVGGGPARHTVFKDFTAPLRFSSQDAVQSYMNRVCFCFSF